MESYVVGAIIGAVSVAIYFKFKMLKKKRQIELHLLEHAVEPDPEISEIINRRFWDLF